MNVTDAAPENRDILISCAGTAGPALAWWLGRYGFNPTVVERTRLLGDKTSSEGSDKEGRR